MKITKMKYSRAQIAIEFVLLIGVSIAILISALVIMTSLASDKTDEKTYYELDDFGKSIQQEVILASEMENGYIRQLDIPITVNGRDYTILTNVSYLYNTSHIIIQFRTLETYYVIPPVNGTFKKGINILKKMNDTLIIS